MTEIDEGRRLDWIGLEGFVKRGGLSQQLEREVTETNEPLLYAACANSTHTNLVYTSEVADTRVPGSSYYPPPHMVSVPISHNGKPTTQSQFIWPSHMVEQTTQSPLLSQLHFFSSTGSIMADMQRYQGSTFTGGTNPPSPSSSQHSMPSPK